MELSNLFLQAFMPVVKVLLIAGVGVVLATDRVHVLGPVARHHLNNLVFYVFSPALMVSNLARTITLESLATLWFMPVNLLLTFIIGSMLGWILIKITNAPPHLKGLVIGCCSAGNSGFLLLIILPSLCREKGSRFGDSSTCSTLADAYASLSMAILAVYIWSYVYGIMRVFASRTDGMTEPPQTTETIDTTRETKHPSDGTLSIEEGSDRIEPPHSISERKEVNIPQFSLGKVKQHMKLLTRIKLSKLLAPSTIGAIVGLIIGMAHPVRKSLIGDGAPLRSIYSSVVILGDAAIPCTTLIVGGNLPEGLKQRGIGPALVVGIVAVRFMFLPPIGIGIVKAARHFGIVGSNPLLELTLMIQYAVPPAMAISTIAQLLGAGGSEYSVILLWTYGVASFFLTLWSAFFIWLLG